MTRGGKRPNAGRKKSEIKKEVLSIRIEPGMIDRIKNTGLTASEVVSLALSKFFGE